MSDVLSRVTKSISETTRYPTKLLKPDADIEIDLGIDSVKRVEIVVALGEEFSLDLANEERDENVKTIRDIASWVESFLPSNQPVERFSNPAPTPVPRERTELLPRIETPACVSDRILSQAPASSVLRSSQVHSSPVGEASKPLAGRVALITGSGRGIGQSVARFLSSRGATVIINSFHSREQGEETVRLIESQGGEASHLWGSIASSEQVDGIFDEIERQFGGLDILICNASDGQIGSFLDLDTNDWDRAFRTNVTGHYQCCQRAFPLMRARGGGSIVTMSAVGAHHYVDGLGSQGVVKAAVESMTKYFACELGPYGIRANCVAGGPVYGDLISKFPNADAYTNRWESVSPDGELTNPMDLARTIAFLVSDEARGINGAVWTVDHGFSASAPGQHELRASKPAARPAGVVASLG